LQIDPEIMSKQENAPAPLLEIQLELVTPDIVWKPDLSESPDNKVLGTLVCVCVCVCACVCVYVRVVEEV